MNNDMRLSTAQVAERLGVSEQSVRRWRSLGKGPAYVKIGNKVWYETADLASWVDANRIRPSPPLDDGKGTEG